MLVGDNPFHGISHLSQARARTRTLETSAEEAAHLVELSLKNGADGFMFSVSDITLAAISRINEPMRMYAIAPYAYEYVRKATAGGGVTGLAKGLVKELLFSSNVKVVASNAAGLLRFDLPSLIKTYVAYELSRIKSAMGKSVKLECFMLHEIITDIALALDMKDLCKKYICFLEGNRVRAGFETRNFPYLVKKFEDWGIDLSKLTLTASFNKSGFQMCPSQLECVEALQHANSAEVIAMSVLAAGYHKPAEAADYLSGLQGLSGLVIGVSKERQAKETFRVFREKTQIALPA